MVRSSSCQIGRLVTPRPGLAPRVGPDERVKMISAPSWTTIQAEAEKQGVFAVPTFVVDGELFWGQDRIDFVRAKLAAKLAG